MITEPKPDVPAWGVFLEARAAAIRWLHAEGKTDAQILRILNLEDARHILRIREARMTDNLPCLECGADPLLNTPGTGALVDLYDARLDAVIIMVNTNLAPADARLKDKPTFGLYRMTGSAFRAICDSIAARAPGRFEAGREVAQDLDTFGLSERVFRLSHEVADWLADQSPVGNVFAYIG